MRALQLYSNSHFDIYITGSNANLLSRELATLLKAEGMSEIQVNNSSYVEFLRIS
ncbi:MAG: hypothetical protein IPM34_13220 [Saprospiraceae bacterium]|nr:hypothetical protein [Saprospiraceae bacterium]